MSLVEITELNIDIQGRSKGRSGQGGGGAVFSPTFVVTTDFIESNICRPCNDPFLFYLFGKDAFLTTLIMVNRKQRRKS